MAAVLPLARGTLAGLGLTGALLCAAARAEQAPGLSLRGSSGLIEMPQAAPQPDGQIAAVLNRAGGLTRSSLSFQATPRLQLTLRYTGFRLPLTAAGITGYPPGSSYFDRAFDLHFLLRREQGAWPALAFGLRDFAGTGMDSGEYLVATRRFGRGLRVTAGLGWGSLGTRGALFRMGDRPAQRSAATGGTPNPAQWFRGPAAPFAGVEWQATDRLRLKAEWSSDGYADLSGQQKLFRDRSPVNVGFEYQISESLRLGSYALYGSEIGVSLQFTLNPRYRGAGGIGGRAPLPVAHRPAREADPAAWSTAWSAGGSAAAVRALAPAVQQAFAEQGLRAEAMALQGDRLILHWRNLRYGSSGQALGRAARALSRSLPSSVGVFDLRPVAQGMALSSVTLRRSDLEALEHQPDQTEALWQRLRITEAGQEELTRLAPSQSFTWGLTPYLRYSLFDPDSPLRFEAGLRLRGDWSLSPGLLVSGTLEQRLAGTMGRETRPSSSVLPHVRTDDYLRDRRDTRIESLYLAWYARPGPQLYSRVTGGYLERGYAGISGELLWKPVRGPLALGLELHHLRQRAFDRMTGFSGLSAKGGHASLYYEFPGGYLGQLDVGRYLAGDRGATLSLGREFASGWRIGAFATLTSVSRQTYGEGSFDKGIRVTVPLSWFTGGPTRQRSTSTIRMLQRDGGARLQIPGPLYEKVREGHPGRLHQERGLLWR